MLKSARIVRILVSLMMVTVLTVSCSKEDNGSKPTPTTQDALSQDLIMNPAISRSGALVVASHSVEGVFNPFSATTDVEKWVNRLVFESLMFYDELGELKEELTESYEVSEDRLSITIKVTQGVMFHDGSQLTATDIAFTYDLAKLSPFPSASLENLTDVVVVDDYTVEFKFNQKRFDQYNVLTLPILSKASYDAINEWGEFVKPVGTGLFMLETYSPGESIVLIRNVSHLKHNAQIPGIIIRQLNSEEAMVAFSEGKIDLFEVPTSKAIVNDVKALGFGRVLINQSNLMTLIGLNMRSEVLSEVGVRKALLSSLNRELFILSEWDGYADSIDYLTTSFGEYEKGTLGNRKYPFNFEIAEVLLTDIGWVDTDADGFRDRDGERMSLKWLVFADLDWSYNLAEEAVKNWRALGVDVKIEYTDFVGMMHTLKSDHSYDMWNMSWQLSDHLNPGVLFGVSETENSYNFSGYDNIVANQIFNALNNSSSPFEVEELLTQWHLLQTEELPYLPISRLKTIWAYNTRVKNLSINTNGSWAENMHLLEIDVLQ